MSHGTWSLFLLYALWIPSLAFAQADWGAHTPIGSPRENIFKRSDSDFLKELEAGKKLALFYPVTVSELLIPYPPLTTFFESDPQGPLRKMLFKLARKASPFKSMEEVFQWLGVHEFPLSLQTMSPNPLPVLTAEEKALPMGATIIETQEGEALTFGCAACHVGNLFGVKVLGLTNRFPRANEFFREGKALAPYVNSFLFQNILQTTHGERALFAKAKHATKWVGAKKPMALGLDTSLAQVSLSLSLREEDPYATRTLRSSRHPRPNKLEKMVADSKPAVWWNVKYKNRWLSDGSIISGNPIHTNFLWNEIGRGTDLKRLEKWLLENTTKIEALTTAVFASRPPRYEVFMGENSIDLSKARRGQKHFISSCQRCHGSYQKAWDLPSSEHLSLKEKIQTTKVIYPEQTPVINVGTDPGRYLGMSEFAVTLNRLAISQSMGTVVVPQKGYVPPPLVGIWARWPYFHNNAIPNLCALLTRGEARPVTYYAGDAENPQTDFDQDCVGYPLADKTPSAWKSADFLYNTNLEGLSRFGHDEGIILNQGKELYTPVEKSELIEFLKTL